MTVYLLICVFSTTCATRCSSPLLFLIGCLVIGLLLAFLLDQRIRAEGLFRGIFLFPMAISFIVTGVAWRWLLNPGSAEMGSSGVNLLFEKVGLGLPQVGLVHRPNDLVHHP